MLSFCLVQQLLWYILRLFSFQRDSVFTTLIFQVRLDWATELGWFFFSHTITGLKTVCLIDLFKAHTQDRSYASVKDYIYFKCHNFKFSSLYPGSKEVRLFFFRFMKGRYKIITNRKTSGTDEYYIEPGEYYTQNGCLCRYTLAGTADAHKDLSWPSDILVA